jgi:glycosyltransferase involved in cell wall biosynthesis
MDVLHVIHQFPPESRGGSESYLFDVAQRQRQRGLDVQVLSGSKHARDRVVVESGPVDGLLVHRLHRDDLFFDHHAKMWHSDVEHVFAELLRRWRPKLLHVHHWVRLTCNLIAVARQEGVPAVATLHDYYTSCPRAFRRRSDDAACRRALSAASCGDCVPRYGHEPPGEIAAGIELFRESYRAELSLARAVFVATASTADLLAQTTDVPRDRYQVLPLGYRPRFAELPPLPLRQPGERWRFAFWGGVGRHKGVDVLVRAFARLHRRGGAPAELHVLGGIETPDFERELRAAAADLPIVFHGAFTSDRLHAVAPHIGVFPSTCIETYGLVLDECFELGLPCITSDLGALPERAGVAGIAVRAGDDEALAAAMQRFVDEPDLWPTLRAARPAASPSLDEHVDALLAAYERARTHPPRDWFAGPVEARRRVWFLQKQRESALGRIVPAEGPR